MPKQIMGVVSVELTTAELEVARALRRARENDGTYWPSKKWDYTEHEEFDYEIRSKFNIPSGFLNHVPITNFMEIFNDE